MSQRVSGMGMLRWPAGRAIGRKEAHGPWRGLGVLGVQAFNKSPDVLHLPDCSARAEFDRFGETAIFAALPPCAAGYGNDLENLFETEIADGG